ncbi:MAG: hypothetical protein LH614_09450, partial [Pyrinomonadaceae bacterium]|nr:hypothetical protein [Pyrinomonadaceae bacterium]
MHKDEKGKWQPNYLFKSPRECKTITIKPEELENRVLIVRKDREKLKDKKILTHIEKSEKVGLNKRPTLKARENWFNLGERKFGDAAWIYVINDRYITFENKEPKVYLDCELFDIYFNDKATSRGYLAYLNSSIIALFSEIGGRTGLGQGALKTQVYEVQKFFVPKPELLSEEKLKSLENALDKMLTRQIGSILEELGANLPEEVSFEKVKADRLELDKIVLRDILGLNETEHLEVYRAVVDLVKSRLEKAKS